MTAMLPALSGSSIIYGMGLLEMGIVFSYAQLLIDCEFVRMVRRIMQGIAVNEETLAVEVIKSVGAGGNYLSEKHTRTHMRGEHSMTALIDRRPSGNGERADSKTMLEKAEAGVFKILENHVPAPLSDETRGKLREIVQKAEAEL